MIMEKPSTFLMHGLGYSGCCKADQAASCTFRTLLMVPGCEGRSLAEAIWASKPTKSQKIFSGSFQCRHLASFLHFSYMFLTFSYSYIFLHFSYIFLHFPTFFLHFPTFSYTSSIIFLPLRPFPSLQGPKWLQK